jgi:hypothetical protein
MQPSNKSSPAMWYLAPKNEAHKTVQQTVSFIRQQQSYQRREMRHFMELYAAGNVSGLGRVTPREHLEDYLYEGGRGATRFNMSSAVCDTAVSMVAQTPAVPQYLTTGGDFGLMRKAEKRSQVLQSQINDQAGDLMPRAFLDCTKVGSGFIGGCLDDDGIPSLERVHALELLVEHRDGINGKPRSMHRVYLRSREVLRSRYPQYATEIDRAPSPSQDAIQTFGLENVGDAGDMIEVIESHHIASNKRQKKVFHNGRHTVCLVTATLDDERYEHDEHPYVKVDYRERDFGFFGSGLVEATREAQMRVNELIGKVARGQDLASTLIIANPDGENAVKAEMLSNEIALILNFDPTLGPPQLMKWDGTLIDLQKQIDLEFERVLQVEGLSQEQVNGEGAGKGLTSGVAVRAADDVQSRRLVSPTKRYQSFCISVAKLLERLNDDAVAAVGDDGEYEVKGKVTQGRKTFLTSSKWSELHIEEGQVDIVMMPMSALPTTPQGKWAAVQEWIGSGFVSKQYAMSLLQFPDIDAYADVELAHLDMVQWQVEKLLDGKQVYPYPRQDLQMALDLVTKSELKAIMMGASEDIIDMFEAFLVQTSALIKQATPPPPPVQLAPPMMGPPGAPHPGAPMGPPPGPQGPPMIGGAPVMQPRPPMPVMRPQVAA